jgi:hypothetical protein
MNNAARQFMLYSNNPTRYGHVPGRVNSVRFNPDINCGSSNVYIENQATANLYNYTPYQPNQAALNAGVDSDPQIEQVRFFLEGTALKEGVINPTGDPPAYTGTETISIVSDNVQNLATNVTTFQYYDANGAEITDYTRFGSVRSVTIHILVDNDLKQPPAALELRSSATLRNLR